MSKDLVSVIVVSLEKGPMLTQCLDSIASQTHKDMQCFVFLNKADEKLACRWKEAYKGFEFDHCLDNELYCRPMNKGIARSGSGGDFVLCLNDDVVLSPDYIKQVLAAMERDKRIGSVSGCLLREDKRIVDSTGFLWARSRKPYDRGYGKKMRPAYKKDGYIFGVNGAAAFYRRSMLEAAKLGGEYFDERFGFYYEDFDLAWRAYRLGWLAFYCSSAVAYHKRGATAQMDAAESGTPDHPPQRGGALGNPLSQGAIGLGGLSRFLRQHPALVVRPVCHLLWHFAFTRISPELQARFIRNRYATILKNDRLSRFLMDLPWIIFYEARIYLYLLFFRRSVLKEVLRRR
ncbi:MAG: glycosyltransferase family 2 protein [Candidatus Omnitrophota bacterium]